MAFVPNGGTGLGRHFECSPEHFLFGKEPLPIGPMQMCVKLQLRLASLINKKHNGGACPRVLMLYV
ncbi:unnamed protein product [Cyberlindnera jadinii]|uniref:Uncharacterized protein n=1 Tax=Cyberlindnera jadinii (strain ATCC 18201 / CBS 1600 / BCRC 20928 / JCM 3617 / NBRC 0987 / NRRL Y-1542) TaxID=983966 RepID=A0A0H5C4V5_CYBJN|nr:unnamed protein product [Cyberlindnera jadinii]